MNPLPSTAKTQFIKRAQFLAKDSGYPLFKQTEIDQSKSMAVDVVYGALNQSSHKSGGTVVGINAVFGDGHVMWQGVKQNPTPFDPNLWISIGKNYSDSNPDFMYVQSCWQP